eukprot:Amastigsp_a843973_9.p3 type:complete len:112 gc:universal Amastigsp_a843973_9:892-1227(+)
MSLHSLECARTRARHRQRDRRSTAAAAAPKSRPPKHTEDAEEPQVSSTASRTSALRACIAFEPPRLAQLVTATARQSATRCRAGPPCSSRPSLAHTEALCELVENDHDSSV